MNDLSQYAYQGYDPVFSVIIGETDVTERVYDVGEISLPLDYPELNEWEPGECQFALIDPDGEFSTDNENNFFVQRGLEQSGNLVDVQVLYGFDVDGTKHTNPIFIGKITKITQDADEGLTLIVANDGTTELFSKDVSDFGINRNFKIELKDNQGVHGVYPISDFVLPISDGSVDVKKNATESFNQVEQIADTGIFKPENYVVGDKEILSEYLSFPDTGVGFPQLKAKSAYHDRDVSHIIADLLEHIEVDESDVEFPEIERDLNIARNERIGYQILGNPDYNEPKDEIATWKGYPTDIIVEGENYYILYNAPPSTNLLSKPDSMLLKYVKSDDTWHVLYRRKTEMWKIAKSGTKIAILCTDSLLEPTAENDYFLPDIPLKPVAGSYDCTETASNKSYIQMYDEVANTAFTLIGKNANLKAQLGQYYIFGATPYQRVGEGYRVQRANDVVPDSVRNMEIYNNHLYYFYGMSVEKKYHGVAKVSINAGSTPQQMFRIESDGRNHLGGNLIVDSGKVFYLGTARTGAESQLFLVSLNA